MKNKLTAYELGKKAFHNDIHNMGQDAEMTKLYINNSKVGDTLPHLIDWRKGHTEAMLAQSF